MVEGIIKILTELRGESRDSKGGVQSEIRIYSYSRYIMSMHMWHFLKGFLNLAWSHK